MRLLLDQAHIACCWLSARILLVFALLQRVQKWHGHVGSCHTEYVRHLSRTYDSVTQSINQLHCHHLAYTWHLQLAIYGI